MTDVVTPVLGLTLPTVGADANTWGGILNGDLTIIDTWAGAPTVAGGNVGPVTLVGAISGGTSTISGGTHSATTLTGALVTASTLSGAITGTMTVNGGSYTNSNFVTPSVSGFAQVYGTNDVDYIMKVTNAGTDAKNSDIYSDVGSTQFRFLNDLFTSGTVWLQANRSGANVTSVAINSPTIQANGTLFPETIYGGLINASSLSVPTINGGVIENVTLNDTISCGAGASLFGALNNQGTIVGGALNGPTVSGASLSGTTNNAGSTISGGSLSGVGGTLTSATMTGGALNGTMSHSGTISGGVMSGQTFVSPQVAGNATITGVIYIGAIAISTGNGTPNASTPGWGANGSIYCNESGGVGSSSWTWNNAGSNNGWTATA